jgi:hypothetical protein
VDVNADAKIDSLIDDSAVVANLDPYSIKINDWINLVQGSVLPELHFFADRFGNLGNQGW